MPVVCVARGLAQDVSRREVGPLHLHTAELESPQSVVWLSFHGLGGLGWSRSFCTVMTHAKVFNPSTWHIVGPQKVPLLSLPLLVIMEESYIHAGSFCLTHQNREEIYRFLMWEAVREKGLLLLRKGSFVIM